ncbi:cell filamentation protein Fic [Leifsonia xyli subsp. xyli]|uniref:Fido domain-containing protein n=2 Tax=Leifsonia xyli subsp. xyli TaxID=59736 RepID=Q6AGX5_LEIXX|nr:Fic family protein [Leifsonia xyli]AAT88370.1 conserved hypothetical protein [Leifsonia xyli subsp. xyli str. CTCB07]ODA89799.1 cell filamentation protein Fic [Leifsonia xyli subsp. xyli]
MRHGPAKYEETHPCLTFQFSPQVNFLWAKLGEAFSKNQHLAGIPLQPELATRLASIILRKGALGTVAIEGNTLTEDEVEKILQDGLKLPPSQEYLEQEIRNVAGALEVIDESGRAGDQFQVTPEWLQAQNAKLLNELETEEHVVPGEYTTTGLVVGSVYRAAPAEDVPYLIDRMCIWLNDAFVIPSQNPNLTDEMRFFNAFFGAVLGHLYLAWIHPFGDGNGRTARLLEVAILAHSGVVPWVASNLLSDHYNRTRSRYYQRLASTSREGKVEEFVTYAAEGLVDLLREQIGEVRESQMRVAWINYVHDRLRYESPGKTKDRRRNLVLALPVDSPITKREMRRLTPELAEAYAGHEDRMIARDLHALQKLGLVDEFAGGKQYRARAYIMYAFVPIPPGA